MNLLRLAVCRVRSLFRKERLDTEMAEEMRAHLELQAERNVAAGMSPDEARYAARRQFGGMEQIKEQARDQRSWIWLEQGQQDLRYGVRQLLRRPGFSAIIVLTLALGIGANTAIFTPFNALLLRALPVPAADELVVLEMASKGGAGSTDFSFPLYERLRDASRGAIGLFAAGDVSRQLVTIVGSGAAESEAIQAQLVTGEFFSVLGVPALLGRTLSPADDRPGAAQPVVVISHGFWQRRFGGDTAVIGRRINLGTVPCTIVGVMPPRFFGVIVGESPDLWWPLQLTTQVTPGDDGQLSRFSWWLHVMGRAPAAVDRTQMAAGLSVAFQQDRREAAAARARRNDTKAESAVDQWIELTSGRAGWTRMRAGLRQPLFILGSAIALVLLVACANAASLLLARAAARRRELFVRGALGAGRGRLLRQLLTESLLLAGLGGLVGLLFARWGTDALVTALHLQHDSVALNLAPDGRVLGFTLVVSLLTGLMFGLAPAWVASRLDLAGGLKADNGFGRQRLHRSLVVLQIALSLVLLVGAGLFGRTLANLRGAPKGFDTENVVVFDVDFDRSLDTNARFGFYRELIARLDERPGVRATSLFDNGMLSGRGWGNRVMVDGFTPESEQDTRCVGMLVGPRFMETLGMRLLTGSDFGPVAAEAMPGAPRTAVINQTMARRYFGDANPVGRAFYFRNRPAETFEIIGVVGDAIYRSVREKPQATFYMPFYQWSTDGRATLALRVTGETGALAGEIRGVVRSIEPRAQVTRLRTLADVVDGTLRNERTLAQFGAMFGAVALTLTALGVYGVLAFSVVQRTREIGVRIALGASKSAVLALVIRQGLGLVGIGAGIGLIVALGLTRFVTRLLYGVTAADPLTLVGTLTGLLAVALVACWFPARRAAKVDPMVALRCE
jgi:predicted permease